MNYDKMILDLFNRVCVLESEVAKLKEEIKDKQKECNDLDAPYMKINNDEYLSKDYSYKTSTKDTTKYLFNGVKYGKNRLVLAVVKEYMRRNPDTSAVMLQAVFSPTLQGGRFGVIKTLTEARYEFRDVDKRFFTSSQDIIKTSTEDCVVCTQWAITNIPAFIKKAESLGFVIESI